LEPTPMLPKCPARKAAGQMPTSVSRPCPRPRPSRRRRISRARFRTARRFATIPASRISRLRPQARRREARSGCG
jgi:hypothetical protein